METFRVIPSFPDYEVSNFGRVKTKERKLRYVHAVSKEEHFRLAQARFLKVQYNNRTGYKFHQLYKEKKMINVCVHKLVADAFLEVELGKDYINHIDGNKHNNIVSNLERCTNEYNHAHAAQTGLKARGAQISTVLNDISVAAIKKMVVDGVSHTTISKWFGVSRVTISLIAGKKTWKHIN